jgi:Protein of unknown function (DUF3800)
MNNARSQRVLKSNVGEFALFIDESGSPKPNPRDEASYFALGGVLLKRDDEALVASEVEAFKQRWDIEGKALHGNEIRSQKKNFAWLGTRSEGEQAKFMDDLTRTITSLPIIAHACVVSRSGYLDRYLNRYGTETWEMMRSAFTILIERSAKYAKKYNGSIMIYYEEAGKKEDRLIKKYFEDLRTAGHPFDSSNASQYQPLENGELSNCLRGIEGKKKNNPILQVADLCLYPIARSKDNPDDRAYMALKEKNILVDSNLRSEEIKTFGIKYYCFDSEV